MSGIAGTVAAQGDFFFAKVILSDGITLERPVYVIGDKGNDEGDVIVCSCTTSPPRTGFDIPVLLKRQSYVRANKIYTINRAALLFRIGHQLTRSERDAIHAKVKEALGL
jgi:mRNA-degrading endonuclease toxin of MazEF toxin-antitoxin module